ncbi:5-amino-6-(5-phospho-D-ribitylamino)uracil phosphatase, chloroplastic-like [Lotus japonicus]|uniref:5-amino-6-(5-phospho-D-ribitylamino)uracil phosphatase, chloroplastic-like n=1 Tax=Lotus japonicus TaxID=34305 RepID=UPI0025875449|nr:5-amino-6-(5-phospho-D-ribitylamino)uracil phosphatase, chloroplastic-like [Lotus japonicus]XP_057449976.1 5-amino-6-(5-phospho-D-ribitylamino)uracil phosphatase, chloroplastic-like [Lotus japonicus]XP_057449977.1 5-amino-6-(5-phospho-D-ribitylamino)uracil phosphatase, chloroplastic-like [Lotus japonicus]
MVESVAAASILSHRPVCEGYLMRGLSIKSKSSTKIRFPAIEFLGGRRISVFSLPCKKPKAHNSFLLLSSIKASAVELTREVYSYREDKLHKKKDNNNNSNIDKGDAHEVFDPRPWLWPPVNKADNPSLHNPLLRQQRMGCGSLAAIFELEGVLIEDNLDLENQAWLVLSQQEGKSPPPAFILKRIEGMKSEHAVSEVLCWSRDPAQVRRLAYRKEQIHQALQGGMYRLRPGSEEFTSVLMHYGIPMALVSSRPRKSVEYAMGAVGIENNFSVIVAAEDVYRGKPDPEMFMYAAQLLNYIPERCIVFGNSNLTVEAAHDARMKCVAVASKHLVYELGAADLVVRRLDELSVVDLKNLADIESAEFGEHEVEMEKEEFS